MIKINWPPAFAGETKKRLSFPRKRESNYKRRRGFTLVELLIATLISFLVLLALSVPFVAQNSFWTRGSTQVDAQRDAQLVLSTIAKSARQKVTYTAITTTPGNGILVLREPCGSVTFQGGPAFGGQLQVQSTGTCPSPLNLTLIDGVRSRVTNFTPIHVSAPPDYKLLRIQLAVTNAYRTAAANANSSSEFLDTEIHLRNA